jgi:hypothetical protein
MSDIPASEINNYGNLVSLGSLDLEFSLTLSEEEARTYGVEYDAINCLKDCEGFLTATHERKIMDFIGLTSKNSTISSLLYMNKANSNKTFVEFISLSSFVITPELGFMNEVITTVTDSNFFFINYQNVYPQVPNKMTFAINIEGKDSKVFSIEASPAEEEDVEQTEESTDKPISFLFEAIKQELQGRKYFYVDLNDIIKLAAYNVTLIQFCYFLNGLTVLNRDINVIISFPNMVEHTDFLSIDAINNISEIFSLTDTFVFERKEALELFELINQFNDIADSKEKKNKVEWIFLKDIKRARPAHPKIGVFFKELEKVSIIEQENESNLILFHKDFEFDCIPDGVSKVLREDYKKLLAINYSNLRSTFIGGFLSRKVYKKSFKTCFAAGSEIMKRTVELIRFNLPSPVDPKFYLVKIKKEKVGKQERVVTELKTKEKQFVLDCVNSTSSKLREYKPLYDDNLKSYFSSFFVRKHLKKLGFINRKGVILEDPDVKKLGIVKNKKLLNKYEVERKALLTMIENNEKMKLQIENIFNSQYALQNANLHEIEKIARVQNFNEIAQKKLPSITYSQSVKKSSNLYAKEVGKYSSLYGDKVVPKSSGTVKLQPLSKENFFQIINNIENKACSTTNVPLVKQEVNN